MSRTTPGTPTTHLMASTQEQRPDETSAGATTTRTTTRKRSRSAQAPATPDRTSAAHGPYLLPALPDGPFVVKPEDVERLEVSIMPDGVLFVRGTRERLEAFVAACQTEGISLIIDHASMCG